MTLSKSIEIENKCDISLKRHIYLKNEAKMIFPTPPRDKEKSDSEYVKIHRQEMKEKELEKIERRTLQEQELMI